VGLKVIQKYEDIIAVLKAENEQLKYKLFLLENKLECSEKGCACYRNNQKICEKIEYKETS